MNRRWHSVYLDEDACKGCTLCVTTCPTEAIRVTDGKARIIEERCIDCGECIRRCPHHAKKARTDDPAILALIGDESEFDLKIALPAPSLYGQFSEKHSIDAIHQALLCCGFDMVFPVAAATGGIAGASASFLDRTRYPDLPRPLISSSCPTIIKFIQIRFPSLLDNIVPVIAPMELAARLARIEAIKRFPDRKKIGVFFISPCAGKITEAKSPLGDEISAVDGVFSMNDFQLPIIAAMGSSTSLGSSTSRGHPAEPSGSGELVTDNHEQLLYPEDIAWSRAGGEAADTAEIPGTQTLAVDGMDQCVKILEAVEDGKLDTVDFLELMACTGGCVGGPLAAVTPALGRHTIALRELDLANANANIGKTNTPATPKQPSRVPCAACDEEDRRQPCERCLRTERFPARPALQLDPDYKKAVELMERMELIREELPGLDCGCCGAPNCRALAEDIVKGLAQKNDCVIILKEQYLLLLQETDHPDLKDE